MAFPLSIFEATINGDVDTLRAWLNSGAQDLNKLFSYDPDGIMEDADFDENLCTRATLLHAAVDNMDHADADKVLEVVKLLLAHGAGVNAVDWHGETPLHYAAAKDLRMSAGLLECGANLDTQDADGHTPLMEAVISPIGTPERFELVRYLVSHGADVSLFQKSGTNAVAIARDHGHDHIADWLAKIQAAGGSWRRYVREPRVALLTLRELCARGRAYPPAVKLRTISAESLIFERLFGAPASSAVKRSRPAPDALPKEVFWHVLSFWRTTRDDDSKSEEVVVDELRGRAPPGSFYAVTLRPSEILHIDIQSIRYADPFSGGAFDLNVLNHAPAYAMRISKSRSESIPLNVGDIICCIGGLDVLDYSLSEIGPQLQTAMSTERIRLRLYRPRADVGNAAAGRECAFACRAVTPFFNLAHEELVEQPAT